VVVVVVVVVMMMMMRMRMYISYLTVNYLRLGENEEDWEGGMSGLRKQVLALEWRK
jgi:hypothetical protein